MFMGVDYSTQPAHNRLSYPPSVIMGIPIERMEVESVAVYCGPIPGHLEASQLK